MLPAIPLIDARRDPVAALDPAMVRDLRDAIVGSLRPVAIPALRLGDRIARSWLARGASPYGQELERMAARVGLAGVYAINISYEYACTTLAAPDAPGLPPTLRRTLDWPFRGLGARTIVMHREGPAGDYLDVTWPGAIGVLTAMAPGRFAAAINQAPLLRRTRDPRLRAADYGRNLYRTIRHERGMPPLHLLRLAFDTAPDFASALDLLTQTEIARPVLFTLTGARPGEIALVERREREANVVLGPVAVANDWQERQEGWEPRPCALPDRVACSQERRRIIHEAVARGGDPFAWVVPPVRNWNTRIAVEMNAGTGLIRVQGYEPEGNDALPATAPFRHHVPTTASLAVGA